MNLCGLAQTLQAWPQGNAFPIMFVDVVGDEGLSNLESNHGETKVGVDSKFNIGDAKLVVI